MVYVFALERSARCRGALFLFAGPSHARGPGHRIGGRKPRRLVDRHGTLPARPALQISQGAQTGGRPGLQLNVDAGGHITVGGEVIELGRGSVSI